jgi:hypothetical protein
MSIATDIRAPDRSDERLQTWSLKMIWGPLFAAAILALAIAVPPLREIIRGLVVAGVVWAGAMLVLYQFAKRNGENAPGPL